MPVINRGLLKNYKRAVDLNDQEEFERCALYIRTIGATMKGYSVSTKQMWW